MQEQRHKPTLPPLLVSVHQLLHLNPERNLCITPRQGQGTAELPAHAAPRGHRARHPHWGAFHGKRLLPYLRALQVTCSRAAEPGAPSQLPHKTLPSQILTCDSRQTNPYPPTQDSSRFSSNLRGSKMTITGVILTFASQQTAALRKSWCPWPSESARHTCLELL